MKFLQNNNLESCIYPGEYIPYVSAEEQKELIEKMPNVETKTQLKWLFQEFIRKRYWLKVRIIY